MQVNNNCQKEINVSAQMVGGNKFKNKTQPIKQHQKVNGTEIVVKDIKSAAEREKLQKIALIWEQEALRMQKIYPTGEKNTIAFDAQRMVKIMYFELFKTSERKFIAAYDSNGDVHGMSAFNHDFFNKAEINSIIVNPKSIKAIGENKISGVGTSLVKHIAKKVLKNGENGIYLTAVRSAVPFYEKLGFKNFSLNNDKVGNPNMELSANRCKKLVS